MDSTYTQWADLKWFNPTLLKEGYDYAHPGYFHLLWAIPLIFVLRIMLVNLFSKKLDVAMLEKHVKWSPASLLTLIPNIIFFLSMALLVFSLTRPQKTNEKVELYSEGIDIMLCLDISGSMEQFVDLTPNRLEKTKEVARDFVDGRFQDRIGLTIFSDQAVLRTKLTTDYEILKRRIKKLKKHEFEQGGTAIGLGLGRAVQAMEGSKSESKIIILLSDGDNNAGNVDPITMAEIAHASDIKIYTIAVGKKGKAPIWYESVDFFTGKKVKKKHFVDNNLDETTLKKIADIGEGQFFRATNSQALAEIFQKIDQLEKSEIKENKYRSTRDFYHIYIIWAACFLALWLLLKSTFLTNAIED